VHNIRGDGVQSVRVQLQAVTRRRHGCIAAATAYVDRSMGAGAAPDEHVAFCRGLRRTMS
jgi:hypothetical protein